MHKSTHAPKKTKKQDHRKTIVKLLGKPIQLAANLDTQPSKGHCHFFLGKALGYDGPEVAKTYNYPFVKYHGFQKVGPPFTYEALICDVKTKLNLEEFTAQRVASEIKEIVKKSSVGIDYNRVIFDPELADNRDKILSKFQKLVDKNPFTQKAYQVNNAFEAIANGTIPVPDYSIRKLLEMTFNAWMSVSPTPLSNSVNRDEYYLLMFPTSGKEVLQSTRINTFSSSEASIVASVGLGFAIVCKAHVISKVQLPSNLRYKYSVYTPLISFSKVKNSTTQGQWGLGNIISKGIRNYEAEDFEEDFPNGLESLPKICFCKKCNTPYIKSQNLNSEPLAIRQLARCRCAAKATTDKLNNHTVST